jgi:protocatechuate 3,4-dioxygenase beta subunit
MAEGPAYGGEITISGRVMSMQGAPVSGIMITLAGTQEGQIVTDGNGYYAFSGLPPGSYAVRPTGNCAFAPDVANLNDLYGSVTQDIIVSGCGGW